MSSNNNSHGPICLTLGLIMMMMMIPTSWTTTFPYHCSAPFQYVTTSDAVDYENQICSQITDSNYYRIEGGAAINCTNGVITVTDKYVKPLTKALCLNITVPSTLTPRKVAGTSCGAGEQIVSVSVAVAYKSKVCAAIGEWDIARIGKKGTLSGSGYGCELKKDVSGTPGDSICTSDIVTTINIVDTDEATACPGTCKSLYTYSEAVDSSLNSTLCSLISTTGTSFRLAGGSSIMKSGQNCQASNVNNNTLTDAMCGSLPRGGCGAGTYFETSGCSCPSCSSPCANCSGTATTCISCEAANPYLYNSNCYTTCPVNTYANTASTCAACGGSIPYYFNNMCYATCPAGSYQSSNIACAVCTSPCANCTGSASTCTACDATAPFLYVQACYQKCPGGTYNSTTSMCSDCPSTCATCDSFSNCLTCKGDYVLEGGQCKESGLSAGHLSNNFKEIVGIVLGSIVGAITLGIIFKLVISHVMVSKAGATVGAGGTTTINVSAKVSPDTESAKLGS